MSKRERVEMSPAAHLPFVNVDQETGKVANYWNVTASGDYGADCETGRAYAYDLIDHIADTQFPGILNRVTDAMPRGDARGGIEVGFCHIFGAMAAAARP